MGNTVTNATQVPTISYIEKRKGLLFGDEYTKNGEMTVGEYLTRTSMQLSGKNGLKYDLSLFSYDLSGTIAKAILRQEDPEITHIDQQDVINALLIMFDENGDQSINEDEMEKLYYKIIKGDYEYSKDNAYTEEELRVYNELKEADKDADKDGNGSYDPYEFAELSVCHIFESVQQEELQN